jgi:catechol 1,2-dioxygenase
MSVSRSADTLAKTQGVPLTVSGVVYDSSCKPLSGAAIQAWQTNADGEYGPGHGTSQLRCCYLQGAVETDASGRYQIDSIMPGHYKGDAAPPPAHIHFWVSHPKARSLSTELDFAGDPYLPGEASPVVTLHDINGVMQGSFDIVLR